MWSISDLVKPWQVEFSEAGIHGGDVICQVGTICTELQAQECPGQGEHKQDKLIS